MEIVWDEPKRLANLDKHGLDFADLNETFFDKALVIPSHNKSKRLGCDRGERQGHCRRCIRQAGARGHQHH